MPSGLADAWWHELTAQRADVVKVVGAVGDARDCLPVFRALSQADRPTIGIGMGAAGLLRDSPIWRERDDLLEGVPGVGPVVTSTLVADLPELEEHLQFPFQAKCIAERPTSPLRLGERVDVISLPSEEVSEHEMFVNIRWQDRSLAVPLAQLTGVEVDEETEQAIQDWHTWVDRGYEL